MAVVGQLQKVALFQRYLPTSRVICDFFTKQAYIHVGAESMKESELPSGYGNEEDTGEHYGLTDDGIALYKGHIPTTCLQRALLTVGSAAMALNDPTRGDMIAVLGETTGYQALRNMHMKMAGDATGQEILRDQPHINSKVVDLDKLRRLPDGLFGKEYVRFMDNSGITPDSRAQVKYVDDQDLAYVMQRYREIHDFVHLLCGMSISVPHEIAVKWFEMLQTGLPMCAISSVFGPLRLTCSERQNLRKHFIPWAVNCGRQAHFILNVYYEKHFEESLDSLRQRLNVVPAPVLNKEDFSHR